MLKPFFPRLMLSLTFVTLLFCQSVFAGVVYKKTFEGEEQDVGVMLKWSTSAEDNNSMFIIERAEDGEPYEHVGAVGGSGSTNEIKEYNYFDFDVHGSYILYRLKQIDFDGTISFSKPLFINKTNENSFVVAKITDVMVGEYFELAIDVFEKDHLTYQLVNVKGAVIFDQQIEVEQGVNEILVNLEAYQPGTYKLILKMKDDKETLTFKKTNKIVPSIKSMTAGKSD